MKFYAYDMTSSGSFDVSGGMGVRAYTMSKQAAGEVPAGRKNSPARSAAAAYGQYHGSLTQVKDMYISTGGELLKVLATDTIEDTLYYATAGSDRVVTLARKMLPELADVAPSQGVMYDEQGLCLKVDAGTIQKAATVKKSNGQYYIGLCVYGNTNCMQYTYHARRGILNGTGYDTYVRPDYESGSTKTYLSSMTSGPPASGDRWGLFRFRSSAAGTQTLRIDDRDAFITNVLKDSAGKWKYSYTADGTAAVRDADYYCKYWLRGSLYPYTGN